MARAKITVRKYGQALRSAPIPGAGVVRKSKNTMSDNTTIFRLLKVPKYAKHTVASMCERKNEELIKEINRLKRGWMEQEDEIERLRKELERAKGEVKAVKEAAGYGGQSMAMSRSEEDDMEALWAFCGR